VGGSLVKTITAADREVKKSPAKPGGGAGRPKSSPGKNSSIIAKRGNAPPKSASPTKRLGNVSFSSESERYFICFESQRFSFLPT